MKKFLKYAFVAAFATVAGYGVYSSQKADTMSDLMLANVEALADSREGSTGNTGPGEMVDCAGWFTGTKKECMCRYPEECTPSPCS